MKPWRFPEWKTRTRRSGPSGRHIGGGKRICSWCPRYYHRTEAFQPGKCQVVVTIYRVNLGHGFLPDARLRGIFCAGEGQVHRARMPALDQEWCYTTEVSNVGFGRKATKRLISRDSAYGYKPKIRAPQFTSASPPAPEIRTLNYRSWRHCGPNLACPDQPLLTRSRSRPSSRHCPQTGQSSSRSRQAKGWAFAMIEASYGMQRYNLSGQDSSSNSAFASFKSAVSNPSVNQP